MKSEWNRVQVGELCSRVCSGGTPKSTNSEYYGGDIPWLNTREVNFNRISKTEGFITQAGLDNSSAKWIKKNCVIVAMYGATAGRCAITKIPLTTNQACCNLEIDDTKADYRFVYYALKNEYVRLSSAANGGAQQNLNAQQVKEFDIPYPPLPIQRKIASILSALDDKIETNSAICRNLEEQAKCIFKNNYRAGSDFIQGTIGDVVTLQRGYDLPKSKMTKGPYPVVGSTDIIAYHNEYNCDELCIVMGRSGNVGRPRFYIEKIWAHNTSLFSKSFHSAEPVWVYYALSDIDFSLLMGGSAVPTLNRNHVHMQFLNIAPLHKQKEFANEVMPLIWMIFAKEKENRGLAAFRDNLLPKLMSGELSIDVIN